MIEIERIIESCIGQELPPCQAACPLHIDMKGSIALIREGKFDDALRLIREKLPFPGIIGRICTRPCEDVCLRKEVDEPIAIAHLKRSAADYGKEDDLDLTIAGEKRARIAVIGGGPAGLMAAYDLRKMGYQVTIFEALPILGGMLSVGIPEYRLPRDILQSELGIIEKLGVETKLNSRIGDDIKMSDLRQDFDAIFIATGAQMSRKLSIEGLGLEGVLWGMDFLRQVNLGQEDQMKDRVVVVGGGNVAVDVALTALRLGVKEVQLACLESREEMPAFDWEIQQTLDEGIINNVSWGPKRVLGNGAKVNGIELVRCTSVFDEKGRFNPSFDESVTTLIETDMVILAIGQAPDISFLKGDEVQCSQSGFIYSSDTTLETSVPGIFAGGDAVYGPKSVIEALAVGRKAAISIDRYIKGEDIAADREGEGPQKSNLKVNIDGIGKKQRISMAMLPVSQRGRDSQEVELGLSKEESKEEAARCLSCECKLCIKDCEFLKLYCETPKELAEKFKAGYFRENPIIPYSCNLCDLCEKVCPEHLNAGKMCLETRRQLVSEKLGPLPQHASVISDQEWAISDSFALTLPDSEPLKCKQLFFPGCGLSAYSPDLVIKTYEYLQNTLPDTGIILGCCGAPSHDIGEQSRFQSMFVKVLFELERTGASGLIVSCPDCYHTFKENAPYIQLMSVYEIMTENGLPEGVNPGNHTFSIHDSCKTRYESHIQDSVRAIVRGLGYHVEELEYSRDKTRCCGAGGMAPYADMKLINRKIGQRVNEMSYDALTYCVACRDAFALVGKPSLHVLDLIFNPEWQRDKRRFPVLGEARRESQSKLRAQLLKATALSARQV